MTERRVVAVRHILQPDRSDRLEILDCLSPEVTPGELRGNLRDIQRANRFFGGVPPMTRVIRRICQHTESCTLLDVATGSADVPLALIRHAEREGRQLRVVATDLDTHILEAAAGAEQPGRLRVERADARDLPYPDNAFDIVTLSLALHHFPPDEAAVVLAEMGRVARVAMVVSDLSRSWHNFAAAWLFANLTTRNRLTRHDAPLSVRRAYTADEAQHMAVSAGWTAIRVKTVVPCRFLLVGRPR